MGHGKSNQDRMEHTMKYEIRATYTFEDGTTRRDFIGEYRSTCRGTRWFSKTYKTRGWAQRWIDRRMEEIKGTLREGVEHYEVVERSF